MKIFITGGLGFVGSHLSNFLLDRGHHVTAIDLFSDSHLISHENYRYISADTTQTGTWQEALKDMDAAVNLAGASIFKRWTKRYKQLMYDSRILTTRNLIESIPQDRRFALCSTSAAGYYGNRGDEVLTEDESNGDDFLAEISRAWEAEAFRAVEKGARVVISRFGIVLGKTGGALKSMISAFKWFVGGPLGNGKQWFPWIHIDDLMLAALFVIENENVNGAVNFCAPNPVRNRELAKTLGRILKRPALMTAPAIMIRLVLGEFASAILASQRAVPDKLLNYGFNFQYPDIEHAIRNIVDK
ncbi:MAG: TIGR01777 family protein [Deltaproteobacteria bacterium]|nr:TIGR01777 family protein [Deltaproteobacteria bacterium]